MCYRVATPKKEELKDYVGNGFIVDDYHHLFHTAGQSLPTLPVATETNPKHIRALQWGIKPWWQTNGYQEFAKHQGQTLNAQSEWAFSRKMPFQDIASQHKCLIFVKGFYEFRHEGGTKNPKTCYFIHWPEKQPFALGGIVWTWANKDTGEVGGQSVNILTTGANAMMQFIHNSKNRMPVVIDRENWEEWLTPDLPKDEIKRLTAPFRDDVLQSYKTKYNVAKRDAPVDLEEIQAPLIEDGGGEAPTLF